MPSPDTERVTVAEAAVLCDVDATTIKRDLRRERYPGASRGPGPNDPWLIPLSDLEAAGRYTPPPEQDELQPSEIVRRRRADRDIPVLQGELKAAELRAELLQEQLDFLRGLLEGKVA